MESQHFATYAHSAAVKRNLNKMQRVYQKHIWPSAYLPHAAARDPMKFLMLKKRQVGPMSYPRYYCRGL